MKECKRCKETKELSEFKISKRKEKTWYMNTCITCENEKYMENYYKNHKENKEALRHKIRKHMYGISKEDFYLLLEKQNYSCAICNTTTPGGRGDWHVDHNHDTGKIRGLLCHCCNTGLGLFKDNVDLLDKAKEYLNER